MSLVTCHMSLSPQLCTVGWFPKTQKPQQIQNPQIIKTAEENIYRYANITNTLIEQTQNIRP